MSSIKQIVKKTHYFLLKPVKKDSNFYYVRTYTEGLEDNFVWFIGRENSFGLVSSVGPSLNDTSPETVSILEKEFQENIGLLK